MGWKGRLNVFHHIYSKDFDKSKKKMKMRKEDQEYPNKPLDDAFMDRLYDKSNVSSSLLLIK